MGVLNFESEYQKLTSLSQNWCQNLNLRQKWLILYKKNSKNYHKNTVFMFLDMFIVKLARINREITC